MAASSSSQVPSESWQVFINFRGQELRQNFISHLEEALDQAEINYFIDSKETRGEDLSVLLRRIEQSQIALPIFSIRYAESSWCLDELEKIMEQVGKKKLRIIPIFFNVTPDEVQEQKGKFGLTLYGEGKSQRPNMQNWEKALRSVPSKMGLTLEQCSNERELVKKIVASVKEVLAQPVSRQIVLPTDISSVRSSGNNSSRGGGEEREGGPTFEDEMNQRLKQLEEMINFGCTKTRIVGIVGMPGIGKTTLAEKYFNTKNDRFVFNQNFRGIREKSEEHGPDWLKNKLLNGQEFNAEATMFTKTIFLVLDDVSHKNQVSFLLEKLEWIKQGSKIVITTRDKSLITELVHDTYVVPGLNDKDALELFKYHAFESEQVTSSTTGDFPKLSKKFVDYAGGNPRALKELGKELCGENEAHWKTRVETLPHCCNENIKRELRISYDKLTDQQKDAFLDIACFFRSEEEDYVKCLLDPYGSESGDEVVKDLAEKLLICISAGRIEMHNLLCTLGTELGSSVDQNNSGERMWNHDKIIETLRLEEVVTSTKQIKKKKRKVRGIFLDTSKEEKAIPVDKTRFFDKFHKNLRYLKIYDSLCPSNCKVNLPEGLAFRFPQIRYLHWLKFPLEELPPDFEPENLIDLRLPYSTIIRVWEGPKEMPRLKWVDLSYSTNLVDLSALSNAFDLRRLNLEGCTVLAKLPEEMKNMKSLVFLNLRGCVMLSSLPEKLDLISLKTLILSGCSNFNKFDLISKNLEFLHLDGTAIERLPSTIMNFQKLVVLNLKNCKMLECLPDCLDKLKALEELILSGCSGLRRFPEIKENMENLHILLLDGTSIKELPEMLLHCGNFNEQLVSQRPKQMKGLSMLRRLCLSRNDMICSLQSSISQLYHLNWIDLRYCRNLTSLLTLPPNLQYLNAHACSSLKTVASPLALLLPKEQVSSSFIFTNCDKLEHLAKNDIICYAHNKSRLLSDALNRHNKGLAFETLVGTCFPGNEVPAWFNHRASGAVLEAKLLPSDKGFVGTALCAIVSFRNYKIRNNNFMVKCICEFNNVDTSSSIFNFHIGDLSEKKDEQCTIKSTHVFIGFTSWLNMDQCQEMGLNKGSVPSKASIKFEVTDGTCEAANCEVLKCGFSLVCESDNGSWNANADARSTDCESDNVSSDVTADTSPIASESGNGSWDANVDPCSAVGEVRRRETFLGLLRRRGWLFTL